MTMKTSTLLRFVSLPPLRYCLRGLVVLFLVGAASRLGAIPPTMQYQGYLTDADDAPVTGIVQITFRLYDGADAPTPLWEETHDDVTVLDGRFTLVLGSESSFAEAGVTFETPLYLELELGGERLTPRIALQAVPYAFRAAGVVPEGVTAGMLAPGAVTAGKVHVSLAGAGLALDEGGALKVATEGITADMIAPGAVRDRHIATDAAIAPEKIAGTAVTLEATQTLTNKTLDADVNAILNLDTSNLREGVLVTDLALAGRAHDTIPSADAVRQYVNDRNSLDALVDTDLESQAAGQILQRTDDGFWRNETLGGDVTVGPGGIVTIQADAVALGLDTSGDYLAGINAGAGLSGGGAGEGLTPELAVNVDGRTLAITADALGVAPEGISAGELASDIDMSERGFRAFKALLADTAAEADLATRALNADKAAEADLATRALDADKAAEADLATRALDADKAAEADLATRALNADRAAVADEADKVDGADVDDTAPADPAILWSSAKTMDMIGTSLDATGWYAPVSAIVDAVPEEPYSGERVIAAGVPGWNDDSIYTFDGTVWRETVPEEGATTWVEALEQTFIFSGGAWQANVTMLQHNQLSGIQGGNATEAYHLTARMHDALTGLVPSRLMAADDEGVPQSTSLAAWISGTSDQILLTDNGDGTVTLSLPQDLAPDAAPSFAGLTLANTAVTGITDDGTLAGDSSSTLPTEHAVKTYVDTQTAARDSLGELVDVDLADVAPGDLLQFDGAHWHPITLVPGENIQLKAGGGLTHGSGLMLDLAADGTLVVTDNKVGVGLIGHSHIAADAVELGTQTDGDYVAGIVAGDGLLGDTSGETATAELSVNVDGVTIGIKSDQLRLVDGGITSRYLAPGAVAAAQLAPGIDASAKGFVAAAAVDADRVDGADVDDTGAASPVILWSSARVVDYVDSLINGLEWGRSVDRFATEVPPDPTEGMRVIARGVPEWTDECIYEFAGEEWNQSCPVEGAAVWVVEEDRSYVFNGTEWVTFGSTQNHEALSGLQGGAPNEHFHLTQALYDALRHLGPSQLLAADAAGLPATTSASAWIAGTSDQIIVTDPGDGTVVLSLAQLGSANIAPDAVALGSQTTGRYVAAVLAGDGLSGGADGEAAIADLRVLVDGTTVVFDPSRALRVGFVPVDRVGDALSGVDLTDRDPGTANGASLIGIDPGAVENVTEDTVQGALVQLGAAVTEAAEPQMLFETVVGEDRDGAPVVTLQAESATDMLALRAGDGLVLSGDAAAKRLRLDVLPDDVTIRVGPGGELAVNGPAIDAGSVDGADVDDEAAAAPDILWSSAKTKDFIVNLLNGLDWQASVKSIAATPPAEPLEGDRYIAATGATGGWTPDWLYQFDGTDWLPIEPDEGFAVWVEDEDKNYVYNGSAWVTFGSTQNHEALVGLQGGTADQHYHLTRAMHDALTELAPSLPLASDASGLPTTTTFSEWIRGTVGGITVTADADGGVTLNLPSEIPLADPLEDTILMGDGTSWFAAPQTRITSVGTIEEGTWQGTPIDGAYIDLAPDGAITHGSGLKINLADDGSLVIDGNALGVGVLQARHIGLDSVALGAKTVGDYVASIHAGDGLAGEGIGEGSTPTLRVKVDEATLAIADGALKIAAGGVDVEALAADIDASGVGFIAAAATDADRVDGADVDDMADPDPAILWSSAKIRDLLDDAFMNSDWQNSVLAMVDSLPTDPETGDRYIVVAATETKSSGTVPNWIYTFDGMDWRGTAPNEGGFVWVESDNALYVFAGDGWTPLDPDKDHNALSGLQGGGDNEYYHLDAAMYTALTGLDGSSLVATDEDGLPVEADLAGWVSGTTAEIVVTPAPHGGIVLELDSQVAHDTPVDGNLLMGNGSTWASVDQSAITRLGIVTSGTWHGDPVDAQYIDIDPRGGLTHGSGLKLNLDPDDPALIVDPRNVVRVHEITGEHILDGSLTGDDVADQGLTGDDLADQTLRTTHLLGLDDPGEFGQPILSDGSGGFLLGSSSPMLLAEGTENWRVQRNVSEDMSGPTGLIRDDRGTIYAADPANHCIWVFSSSGVPAGWFGRNAVGVTGFHTLDEPFTPTPGTEPGAFAEPRDVAFQKLTMEYKAKTSPRFLWIADTGNDRLQRVDLDDPSFSATVYTGDDFDEYGLSRPAGVAVAGNVICVSDTGNDRVWQAEYRGYFMAYGWYGFDGADGAFHPAGETEGAPQPGSGDLMFTSPTGVDMFLDAGSGASLLIVADSGNYRACVIDFAAMTMLGWMGAASDETTGWHSVGRNLLPVSGSGPGAFRQPTGVAINSWYIAITDFAEDLTQIFTQNLSGPTKAVPRYLTTLGGSGTAPGQFDGPNGTRFDADGGLWVSDTGNARLQKFIPPHPENYAVVPPENGNVIIGGDVPLASAALQIDSPDGGILIPRLSPDQMDDIVNPAEGLLVFSYGDRDEYGVKNEPALQGFFFWNGSKWERIGELHPGEVTSEIIAPGAVTTSRLASASVTGDKIADDSIPDSKLQTIQTAGKVRGSAVQLDEEGGLVSTSSGLAVDTEMFVTRCPTVITVCTGESIQAAIDSITDAGPAKPYLIRVAPGIYAEKIILISHVDIVGSGIGKTIIHSDGAPLDRTKATTSHATVTAVNVENAGLRDLTIEAGRDDGDGELVGVFYDSQPAGRGLLLRHTEILVSSGSGSIAGGAWGILGPTSRAVSGLSLDHVTVDLGVATGSSAEATGLDLMGDVTVRDSDIRVKNATSGEPAVGVNLFLAETMPVFQRCRIETGLDGTGVMLMGTGQVTLDACHISFDGNEGFGLMMSGETLWATIRETTIVHRGSVPYPGSSAKINLDQGMADLNHCDLLGPGESWFLGQVDPVILQFYYCRLTVPSAEYKMSKSKSTIVFFRCVGLDVMGLPLGEMHNVE